VVRRMRKWVVGEGRIAEDFLDKQLSRLIYIYSSNATYLKLEVKAMEKIRMSRSNRRFAHD